MHLSSLLLHKRFDPLNGEMFYERFRALFLMKYCYFSPFLLFFLISFLSVSCSSKIKGASAETAKIPSEQALHADVPFDISTRVEASVFHDIDTSISEAESKKRQENDQQKNHQLEDAFFPDIHTTLDNCLVINPKTCMIEISDDNCDWDLNSRYQVGDNADEEDCEQEE